jgi:D-3-phosphoglycerate dehydrogenase
VVGHVSAAPTVVITDHPWPTVEIERGALSSVGARVVDADGVPDEMLLELVVDADGIITCFRKVSAAIIDAAPGLRVVARSGIGVDNIDVPAATRRGIPVTNVPAYCEAEVAEHVIALIFAVRRQIVDYDRGVRAGDWSLKRGAPLHRLEGQTLGVVGHGQLGAAVAHKAQGVGFSVIAYSPSAQPGTCTPSGIAFVTLPQLAERSHVVTLHAPLTDGTAGLIDADFLRKMRRDAVLINTSRGAIVDQGALADALERGTIAGAGLDVFTPERLRDGDRLLAAPNTVMTPHVAYYSEESLALLARLTAESVADVLAGRPPRSIVNLRELGRSG